MKVFQSFRNLLAMATAVALVISVSATESKAARKKPEEKPAAAEKAAALVDINTATAAELEDVPGIGPTYAKKIIANRPYASVSDLSKTGIPANRLEKIVPLVTVKEKVAAEKTSAKPVTETKPTAGEETPKSKSGKTATTIKTVKPAALVDINTATAEQLEEIPGVGPSYAKKIIAKRPYANAKELSKAGIPASKLEKILPLVTVTQVAAATETPAEKAKPASELTAPSNTAKSDTAASKKAKSDTPTSKTTVAARTPPQKGMVWANSDSKVYHVEGDHWYGRTKVGEWMTEADAVKAGYRKAK